MSTSGSKYVWSFNKFLPQFGTVMSVQDKLLKNDSKYTIVQYYGFLEHEYSEPLKDMIECVHPELNIPIEIVNIITVYNSGGIIYDYTKSFEQYTKGNVVYITPIILGYLETFLFLSLFAIMYLMHFQYKYKIFAYHSAYATLNTLLLITAIAYSLLLFIHTVCVIVSYRQCRKYEVIIRNFKRSLYSNKNFSHHVRMINLRKLTQLNDDDDDAEAGLDAQEDEEPGARHERHPLTPPAPNDGDEQVRINIEMQTNETSNFRAYEVIIRNFKRSLYSNKNFSHHVRMINLRKLTQLNDDDDEAGHDAQEDEEPGARHERHPLTPPAPNDGDEQVRINIEMQTNETSNFRAKPGKIQTNLEMFELETSEDEELEQAADGVPVYHNHSTPTSSSSYDDGIMDRWQYQYTYKETQQNEYLSILNPANNSFAYVAYQRWLNVKKLELENDAFTRSKSALVLNLSKYWLTSYFTLIIILIFVIPNSVYLYFAFVLTLFVMYYCYLRTIKNLEHAQALKKVMYLFCSFVIGTIITLIIIFTTEDGAAATSSGGSSTSSASTGTTGSNNGGVSGNSSGRDTASSINNAQEVGADSGVTFWIFDVIFPILEGIFALLYTYITLSLVYKIVKYNNPGYHLWLCSVNAFGFWLLTFWIPSWKITEVSIACTMLLLVSCYLYLQQISHRIMTGLNKEEYIQKHCAPNPKEWLKYEVKQLFVPIHDCTTSDQE
eukprot:CAMPEP_0197075824 /NCGR_PEP_ID=MMETSP1384-20130603/211804_1 /TAXON_ID=29189 /ORGANISM="Ammonia sp." /LENGTH=720 /DNA_ID=CAMNT_0042514673 /DNA_START=84 /DNA_END=2246 /DNA_ORIENTATION=-